MAIGHAKAALALRFRFSGGIGGLLDCIKLPVGYNLDLHTGHGNPLPLCSLCTLNRSLGSIHVPSLGFQLLLCMVI